MNHTPTPWEVYKPIKGKYRGDFAVGTTHKKDPLFCYLAKGRDDLQAANAAFIVRACNAHEALVEALSEMVQVYLRPSGPSTGNIVNDKRRETCEQAVMTALKLALGE